MFSMPSLPLLPALVFSTHNRNLFGVVFPAYVKRIAPIVCVCVSRSLWLKISTHLVGLEVLFDLVLPGGGGVDRLGGGGAVVDAAVLEGLLGDGLGVAAVARRQD